MPPRQKTEYCYVGWVVNTRLDAFEKEMESLYFRAAEACEGYRPALFRREVQARGGLETTRRFLSTGEQVQSGLYRLANCGSLNVSMECLVLRYHDLFAPHEVGIAHKRLQQAATARPDLYSDISSICRH